MSRGQSLLEGTVAACTLLIALAALVAAFQASVLGGRPAAVDLIAYSALTNASTELVAATAYDPAALSKITSADWTVQPPAPPSPAPTGAAGPIALTSQVEPYGDSRIVQLHAVTGPAQADVTLSLRFAAPPPGAVIEAATPGAQ